MAYLQGGWRWRWRYWFWLVAVAIATICIAGQARPATHLSNYELAQTKPFNQVTNYPVEPIPSSASFHPNGTWIGRLILPSEQEYASDAGDWVWFEVWHGVEGRADLLGQKIKLTWQPTEAIQAYLASVTHDINFSEAAQTVLEKNTVVLPERLNGRKQVGPLQSLAGARPQDDVTVRLFTPATELVEEQGRPVLQIGTEPFQISGREYGLVKILGPDASVAASRPEECPGPRPCPTEYFRVQHFNSAARDFSGPVETLRIPQQPMMAGGRFYSTSRNLAQSPAGTAGWYVYGSRDRSGVFTVKALKPRALFQLQPDRVVLGTTEGLHYIDHQNWQQRPGTTRRVLLSPDSSSPDVATDRWQQGDFALVIHLFGGIGGPKKEATPAGTVAGHLAYGLAQVVEEPIAQELQLHVLYQQVYAHNTGGLVAGTHDWTAFTGDMQRGWLGLRPISDVVVKLDAFTTPFRFGDTTISLFGELLHQAQILAARYRTGDGGGMATVTPATSCVQDSNQALFIAIEQIKRKVREHPDIVAWLKANPNSPEIERVARLYRLSVALEDMLTPYGVVRPDWQHNAEPLAGIAGDEFESPAGQLQSMLLGILSWRSMMPRWSHDEVSRLFLLNGAQLWFLRSDIVGGSNPMIEPLPPTTLFGLIPGVGLAVQRLTDAWVVGLNGHTGLLGLAALAVYGAIALPLGLSRHFLRWQPAIGPPLELVGRGLRLLLVPVLVEEILFRVWLLPHPIEGVTGGGWLLWGLLSTGLFGLYQWLLGRYLRPQARGTFCDRTYLLLAGWLGLVLAATYWLNGSLWLIISVHWTVLMVWIYGLGGRDRLPRCWFSRQRPLERRLQSTPTRK